MLLLTLFKSLLIILLFNVNVSIFCSKRILSLLICSYVYFDDSACTFRSRSVCNSFLEMVGLHGLTALGFSSSLKPFMGTRLEKMVVDLMIPYSNVMRGEKEGIPSLPLK